MIRCGFFIFISIISSFVFGQTANQQHSAWVRDNYSKSETLITIRDGVKLFTSVYLQKDASEKYELSDVAYNFAPTDRNPQQFMNIYGAPEKDFKKQTIRIHFDASKTSQMIMPVANK